jgi:dienelactone hydrolase
MYPKHITSLIAFFLALVTTGVSAKPVTVDSLARLPDITSVSMSADGKQLAALVAAPGSNNTDTALATWDLDDLKKGPVVTPSGDKMKFIFANAMKAGRILVGARQEWTGALAGCGEGKSIGSTKTFVNKVYLTDVKHSDFKEAFTDGSSRRFGISEQMERCLEIAGSAALVNNLPLDPTNVIIQRANGLTLQADYFLYNLETSDASLLMRGGTSDQPVLFHPRDGKLLVRSELKTISANEYEQQVLILNEQTGDFDLHPELTTLLHERYTAEISGVDDATGKYYILTDKFSDFVQAWMYDPKTRKFDAEPLIAHPQYSIGNLIFGNQESNFNQLLGFVVDGPAREATYVEANMRSIHEGLKQAYPGKLVNITDYNNALTRVLFTTSSAQSPVAYHVLSDRKAVENLGSQRPWVNSADIGEQKWVTYKARDGLEIPAILDLPAGYSKEDGPIPTVIHPHGGPWARDYAGWDASGWVPFLTSRGFAVLRPEYRGSAGLGRRLWLAGDKEWGQKMQDDKDDGAKWLVDQGIADPAKLVIFGYSYGGFAAAAAVVRPNSPYQCAIAGAPVTDLTKIGNSWSENRLQRLLQGVTVTGMDPMKNVDKANIPVLLFVGDRDVRTPSWHAENFYKAVKDKVPAQFELIPDMPHSMPWYYRQQVEMYGYMEEFLENQCGMGNI